MADTPTEQQESNLNIQAAGRSTVAEDSAIKLSPEAYDELVKRLDEEPREIPLLQEQILKVTAFQRT